MLRIATYNIKHGALKGLPAIVDVLRSLDADLVAVQEVDVGCARSGGVDQARALGEALGLTPVFGPAFPYQGGRYGVLLLSRLPVRSHTLRPLPSISEVPRPDGAEPRTSLAVEVDVPGARLPGGPLRVVVTHLGLDGDERLGQVDALRAMFGGRARTLLLGDLNEGPGGPAFAKLLESFVDGVAEAGLAERRTYPTDAPVAAIDHVLRSPDLPRARQARRPTTDASDHLPIVLELGDDG